MFLGAKEKSYNLIMKQVFLYCDNEVVIKNFSKVCKDLQLDLKIISERQEFIQLDINIVFIDANRLFLDKKLTDILNNKVENCTNKNLRYVIFGRINISIPLPLKIYCRSITGYDYISIYKAVSYYLTFNLKSKKEIFEQRIVRLILLYDYIMNNINVDRDQLCKRFNITERTLFRDIKLIRELFPDTCIMYEPKNN
jgi:hypothetical protein